MFTSDTYGSKKLISAMIKAFIFDLDGVIVNSVDIKTKAFAMLFADEGRETVEKVIKYHLDNAGISRYEKFKHIYKVILIKPLAREVFQELCRRFEGMVVENVIKAPFIKGADEFLKVNATRFKFFLVSATPQEEIQEITQRKNIRVFFKRIYGAPIKKAKAVKEILLKEKLRRDDVIYVGDALSDYEAAKDNFLKFVAVIGSNNPVFRGINCVKIKDFTQLKEVISREK